MGTEPLSGDRNDGDFEKRKGGKERKMLERLGEKREQIGKIRREEKRRKKRIE